MKATVTILVKEKEGVENIIAQYKDCDAVILSLPDYSSLLSHRIEVPLRPGDIVRVR